MSKWLMKSIRDSWKVLRVCLSSIPILICSSNDKETFNCALVIVNIARAISPCVPPLSDAGDDIPTNLDCGILSYYACIALLGTSNSG